MQDINHQVSEGTHTGNPKHTLFVIEDLTGIRNVADSVRKQKETAMFLYHGLFMTLSEKLIYKAKQNPIFCNKGGSSLYQSMLSCLWTY